MHYCDTDLIFMGKKWKIRLFIIYKLFKQLEIQLLLWVQEVLRILPENESVKLYIQCIYLGPSV